MSILNANIPGSLQLIYDFKSAPFDYNKTYEFCC